MVKLTKREQECLYWAAKGKTSWEIGIILGISERTANFHINNILSKFSVHSRQAAIAIAISMGLLNGLDFLDNNAGNKPNSINKIPNLQKLEVT